MFARAAIIGRVTRERAEARRTYLATKEELKKQTPVAPLRRRCFIPFMKVPCTILAVAIVFILCGAVMCNYAFHAKELSSKTTATGGNATTVTVDQVHYQALRSFTYLGPVIMGLGMFIIIISCVVLLDRRDKILKDYIRGMVLAQQEISMELSYRVTTPSHSAKPKSGGSPPDSPDKESKKLAESDESTSLIPPCEHNSKEDERTTALQSEPATRQTSRSTAEPNV